MRHNRPTPYPLPINLAPSASKADSMPFGEAFLCCAVTLFLCCSVAGAQQLGAAPPSFTLTKSSTVVEGVLLSNGRPAPNVLLTTCQEYDVVPGFSRAEKPCERKVELRTDRMGQFRYQQMSGRASFTCSQPCAADPTSVVWFDVWKDGKPWRAFEADKGFNLSYVYLVCDFGLSKNERMPVPSWPDELQKYAPLSLPCKVQRWEP